MWQISYPPTNGASQGNYFLSKRHFSSIPFQTAEILGQNVAVLALGPTSAHFSVKKFGTWLFAIDGPIFLYYSVQKVLR